MIPEKQVESYKPHSNGYRHTCLYCGKIFYGRKNRDYCPEPAKCKQDCNNNRAATKLSRISDQVRTFSKNEEILHKNYWMENTEIDLNFMKELGFDFRGPFKEVKDEFDGAVWYQIGQYAYNVTRKKDKMIIQKL
jgi:hypothetical protein